LGGFVRVTDAILSISAQGGAATAIGVTPTTAVISGSGGAPMPPIVHSFVAQLSNPLHGLVDYPTDRDDILEL
jgi:hypothetical protein